LTFGTKALGRFSERTIGVAPRDRSLLLQVPSVMALTLPLDFFAQKSITGASVALAGMIVNEKETARVRKDTIKSLALTNLEPTSKVTPFNDQLKNGSNLDPKLLPFLNYLVSE
jgi:hypothetical protein